MSVYNKSECMPMTQACAVVGVTRSTINSWSKALGVEYQHFLFDRKVYLLKTDVERLQQFKAEK